MITTYVAALFCVIALAIGQVLFKLTAVAMADAGTVIAPKVMVTLFPALALYGVTTLAWVWVLQKASLGRIYPLMALAFVFVPIASHFVFGEKFSVQYLIGVTLIIAGILIVAKA